MEPLAIQDNDVESLALALPPATEEEPEQTDEASLRQSIFENLVVTGSYRPDEINEAPPTPGVYQMFDEKGKVIYVGKALNLRARLRQYFNGTDERASIPLILRALDHIETILTTTEKEAFILENTLIKRHHPRYNVQLRDDKTYVSVRIDMHEDWPRVTIMRPRSRDSAMYFGPYTSAQAIRKTLHLLQKVFPVCSCTEKAFKNRRRPCLLYELGRCPAPCVRPVAHEEYMENVRSIIAFLKGRRSELVESLRRKMIQHSERLEFEKAASIRDLLGALEETTEKQGVASHELVNRDVVGYHEERGQAAIVLMLFRNGALVESQNWVVPVYGQREGETLSQFIGQYYTAGRYMPSEIFLPTEADDTLVIEEWLGELRGGRVRLVTPQRGDKVRVIEMANTNAQVTLERKLSGKKEVENVLADLAARLHLTAPPQMIECYDIATLQGSMSAGSQVTFADGEPFKGGYRLYKIRGVEGVDDYAMMREVLSRRFKHTIEAGQAMPDLVLVDGGKGQLNIAVEVLCELGITEVAVASLAKDRLKEGEDGEADKTRTGERVFLPGRKNPVYFPPHAPALYLLQRLRDEAHRFVNTYHGKLRNRTHLRSSLEDIPGIAKGRARGLLRHFGSLVKIREASLEELAEAPGMTRRAAESVYNHLRSAETERKGNEMAITEQATGAGRLPKTVALHEVGQSAWLDFISACIIQSGELKRLAETGTIYGVTSNPTIFAGAIGSGKCGYPEDIKKMRDAGLDTLAIYDEVTRRDVGNAADVMRIVYDRTDGLDGFVSLEVSPELAHDEETTVSEALRLFKAIGKPNIFIKVPATKEGIPAIRRLIAAGVNINVTLIFSRQANYDVMRAYVDGLKDRAAAGGDVAGISSVASVFVSRIDTSVDKILDEMKASGKIGEAEWKALRGQAANANARMCYQDFKQVFGAPDFLELAKKGAHPQRPLWASTGTKDPAYPDLKYVEPLVGPTTVNTMPEKTLAAFLDHGKADPEAVESGVDEAKQALKELAKLGIDLDAVCDDLVAKGVESFSKSFRELLGTIEKTR